jgi:hypothetical protein
MNFEFKTRMLLKFFFSNTIEIDFIDISNYSYFNLVSKLIFFISKNEIKQTIKKCKLDNASKSNDIFNRIFKMFVDKLMSHFVNLFRVCAELNYYLCCFRQTHIIILKKSKKKKLHKRQNVQIDRIFEHFEQSFRISNCATHQWFSEDSRSFFCQSNEKT